MDISSAPPEDVVLHYLGDINAALFELDQVAKALKDRLPVVYEGIAGADISDLHANRAFRAVVFNFAFVMESDVPDASGVDFQFEGRLSGRIHLNDNNVVELDPSSFKLTGWKRVEVPVADDE